MTNPPDDHVILPPGFRPVIGAVTCPICGLEAVIVTRAEGQRFLDEHADAHEDER